MGYFDYQPGWQLPLGVGDRVVLRGLRRNAANNGRKAVVMAIDEKGDKRLRVRLIAEQLEEKGVKKQELEGDNEPVMIEPEEMSLFEENLEVSLRTYNTCIIYLKFTLKANSNVICLVSFGSAQPSMLSSLLR